MPSIIKTFLYGLGVFLIFSAITFILKYYTHQIGEDAQYFGIFKNSDLILGLVVAVVVTFSHEKKKKLK